MDILKCMQGHAENQNACKDILIHHLTLNSRDMYLKNALHQRIHSLV